MERIMRNAEPANGHDNLSLRTRYIYSGDGSIERASRTVCAPRKRIAAGETQEGCDACEALAFDDAGHASAAFCPKHAANPSHGASRTAQDSQARRLFAAFAEAIPLAAVMTSSVFCVTPDLSVEALAALLIDKGISGAPVVDDQGRPLGVVSKSDLVRARHENGETAQVNARDAAFRRGDLRSGFHVEELATATVADIMTPVAFSIGEDASALRAVALMARERVHRVLVVGSDGAVVGILSTLDLLGWLSSTCGYSG